MSWYTVIDNAHHDFCRISYQTKEAALAAAEDYEKQIEATKQEIKQLAVCDAKLLLSSNDEHSHETPYDVLNSRIDELFSFLSELYSLQQSAQIIADNFENARVE